MDPNSQPQGAPQPLTPVELVAERPPRRPRKRTRVLGLLFTLCLLVGLGMSLLVNLVLLGGGPFVSDTRVREEFFSHNRRGSSKVAVLSVEGVIYDEEEGFVKRQIDRAIKDEDLKAVVLRVNSPGGSVSDSDYLYHHLNKLREERGIPVVVSMGGIAASGGYYVSMAAGDTPKAVFAEPTTWTGSIGVMIPHYDASKLLEKCGVIEDSITSHPLKGMGSFTKEMTPEEKEILQALVDESFGRFKKIVQEGRPAFRKDPEALNKLATGQVYTADQALELGLVDKIGFLEDAVDRAIELARVDADDVCVVKYKREPTMADILFGARAREPSLDLAALLDLTAPRAYYLYTTIPPLVHNGS
jgi:protease-4